jgi:D-alanine-D-alanine ligase
MKKNVAVLMGGWSAEREVSLSSGAEVAKALESEGYTVNQIDVTRDLPALLAALDPRPDVIFNALHGTGGEDGCLQGVLEMLEIPYTHSSLVASAIAMNKPMAKKILQTVGMPVVPGISTVRAKLEQTSIPFAPPYVIKPAASGSSIGVAIIRPGDNRPATAEWLPETALLIEQYIPGRELTVGVQGFLNEEGTALGITEIKPREGFYDYEAKYTDGRADHIVPADVHPEIAHEVKRLAVLAHETLGCSGVSRSDFRWDDTKSGKAGIYFLEINTQPGMTPLSLVPEQAAHAGMSFGALVAWLVEGARVYS